MKAAIDLHIHSALSPCADETMTPNNIVNMAMLKGLDIIAVTDHNSTDNLEAVAKCAEKRDILFIPGLEIETKEEVHLISLFKDMRGAFEMGKIVRKSLPDIKNREDILGEQLIMDENDNVVDHYQSMLITATKLSVDQVFEHVSKLEGVVIPAHVDRSSYSILSNLGVIPDYYNIRYLEISKDCHISKFKQNYPNLIKYNYIKSSDAHYLGDILERESLIEIDELTVETLIKFLR